MIALLLAVFGLTCEANAASGPTKDQELFTEYKQTHRGNTAFIEKYTKAIYCLDHGQRKTALKLLKELAKEDPKCPGIWVSIGTINLWLEDYPAGIEASTKAISLRPKDADMRRRRALHYIALLKYKEALADLDQAFKLEPTDFDNLRLRASCNKALKRYPEAIADYDRILKKVPDYEEVLHDKARTYTESKDWKNAVVTLDTLFKYYPTDETILLDRASSKMQLNDFKGAVQDYSKALTLGTEAPDFVYKQRALAYEKLGMKKEAARDRARASAGD